LCACITVLNEEDWLHLTLESIYPYVEKIIIVEGAEQTMNHACTKEGLSTDNTAQIIRTFPDPKKKIKFIQVGFVPWIGDLRNVALKKIPKKADWLINMGGDQIINSGDMEYLRSILPRFNDVSLYYVNHLLFWQDPYHLKLRSDLLPMNVPKIYRCYPCIRCKRKNRDDTDLYAGKETIRSKGKNVNLTTVNLHHLGYARGRTKLLNKAIWNLRYIEKRTQSIAELTNELLEKEPLLHDSSNDPYVVPFTGYLEMKDKVEKRWQQIKNL
jgi:hypothetical protein